MTAYQVPAGQDGLTATVTAADPAVVTWPFAAVVAAVSVRPTGGPARIGFRGSAAPGANGVSTYPAGQTTTIRVQAEATPITMHIAADANTTVEIVGYRSTGVLISEPYLAGTVGPGGTVADATTSTKGVAVLMGGTASAPTVPWGSVTGGPTALPPTDGSVTNAKVATNAAISLDKTVDGTTNRVFTSTEKTKLAGVASGATANPNAASIPDFVEAVQDAVAALLGAGSNVILNYDDAANSLTISATGAGGTGLDVEQVRDAIGVALVGVGNIAVTVNDAADTITISTTATQNATDAQLRDRDSHTDGATYKGYTATEKSKLAGIATGATAYTDELAQDAAAALLTAGSHTGISFVYNDASDTLSATVTGGGGSTDPEVVRDTIAAALVQGANIAITANDAADTITIAVTGLTKSSVDLSNVDNTSDANKPISTAQLTALNTKQRRPALDNGLITWAYDPIAANATTALPTGVIILIKVNMPVDTTITNLWATVTSAGATLSTCYAALYDSTGTLLGITADQSTNWQSIGRKQMALTTAVAVTAGTYYIALLASGTTLPGMARASSGDTANAGLAAPQLRYARFGTAQTAMPATINMANQGNDNNAWWVGAN